MPIWEPNLFANVKKAMPSDVQTVQAREGKRHPSYANTPEPMEKMAVTLFADKLHESFAVDTAWHLRHQVCGWGRISDPRGLVVLVKGDATLVPTAYCHQLKDASNLSLKLSVFGVEAARFAFQVKKTVVKEELIVLRDVLQLYDKRCKVEAGRALLAGAMQSSALEENEETRVPAFLRNFFGARK
eukprot:gnl/MRDRNA2_/MRDRNA2_310260_c0_seq1.p1 gnl/MRDRNA2_/MRDRNA2_310260_c0~~gnl/MRDRNA2_/MRDRNA2_310260_c0_seq1.p1  ORF type:complete len:186 (-),score=39.90 gnl/MRDRNA2_/MRDRNA2_310260_c0_seq1:119-676(-)